MKNSFTQHKMLTFLLLMSAFFVSCPKAMSANTFETPDFAYPKTVEANAKSAIREASRAGDHLNVVKGAIQLVIARNEISNSNLVENITLMDSLARTLPMPYSNLMYLIEGTLLREVYTSSSWEFNERNLPIDSFPEDPMEWSRDIFALRISQLCQKALDNKTALQKEPLQNITALLEKDAIKDAPICPTVFDFISYKDAELLQTFSNGGERIIPFNGGGRKSVSQKCSQMREQILEGISEFHSDDTDLTAWAYAFVTINQPVSDNNKAIRREYEEAYKKCEDTPASLYILASTYPLLEYRNASDPRFKTWYERSKKALERFPEGYFHASLNNIMEQASQEIVTLSLQSQYLSTDSINAIAKIYNSKKVNLLLYQIPYEMSDLTRDNIIAKGSRKVCITLETDSIVPFAKEQKVSIPNLGYGRYVVVASKNQTLSASDSKYLNLTDFIISDIAVLTSNDNSDASAARIYVVDGKNQKPIANAKVVMTNNYGGKNKWTKTETTNNEGWVFAPKGSYDLIITKGKDRFSTYNNVSSYKSGKNKREIFNVLTDLSVYHPGDSVGFVLVASEIDDKEISLLKEKKVQIRLMNPNFQPVDTLNAVTDEFGRTNSRFKIPTNGILGNYTIQVLSEGRSYHGASFNVAEYVAPTFFVEILDSDNEYQAGDPVRIKGRVMTYSGMPVGDANVTYTIRYNNFLRWWYSAGESAVYGGETVTDGNGDFEILLNTEGLKGSDYSLGCFTITAAATNSAGETQASAPSRFGIGAAFSISPNFPSKIQMKGENVQLPVTVTNILGNETTKSVEYKIVNTENDKTVAEGSFVSPTLSVPAKTLPSGRYKIFLSIPENGEEAQPLTKEFIVYRTSDSRPPTNTCLWLPETQYVAKQGEKEVEITYGSSYPDSWILVQVTDSKGYASREWKRADSANKTIKVKAPGDNEKYYVTFSGMHNLESQMATVTIVAENLTKKMTVEAVSFRDKITPGDKEKWTFRFTIDGAEPGVLPAMSVMSNKALNAISPFSWTFSPRNQIYWSISTTSGFSQSPYPQNGSWYFGKVKSLKETILSVPEINYYDRSLYASGKGGYLLRGMYRTTGVKELEAKLESASIATDDMMMDSAPQYAKAMAFNTVMTTEEAATPVEDVKSESTSEETPLRKIECPLAFFYPSLITNRDGTVDIEFEVPNFNTTWQLQVLGYDPQLWATCGNYESVASKKVMVQTHTPRFLRTGDQITLKATLMNNTDHEQKVEGRIRIFNPLTNETLIDQETAPTSLPAKGSCVVSVEYKVPDNLQFVGIASYAKGEGHTDGEQGIVPILPSSTPVIEGAQFYLGKDQRTIEMELPSYQENGTTTLTYCDNPIWLCLTALPDLKHPASESILCKASALFANAVSSGIAGKYPQAKEAIAYWSKNNDGTLVSNLQKNESLKLMALDETIWVQNAESETLRMSKLANLLDQTKHSEAIAKLIDELIEKQNADGSWSWCDGMRGSEFITMRVLETFASLKRIDMYPTDKRLPEMISKAIKYCDNSLYTDYVKSKKQFSTTGMLRYLSVRTWFKVTPTEGFTVLKGKALAAINKEWKNMPIKETADAAILLNREGYPTTARNILESLRQRAISKPGKGVWYDNLQSRWGGTQKLLTTSRVLEAFSLIAPQDAMVDGLRQWLILQKQALDWGENSATAEVVSAIMGSGTEWMVESESPQFALNGKILELPEMNKYTGEFVMPLSLTAGGKNVLTVIRDGTSPAWGGVISQYVSPISEVKAKGSDELRVTKRVLLVKADEDGEEITESRYLRVGDKVRVTLTITNDRDLQYVAMADGRSAALEPIEQLSRYTSQDGLWYYQEVRNAATNLFIEYLPKGTHIISYDCYVSQEGEFSLGISNGQSLYAPTIVTNSGGSLMQVE